VTPHPIVALPASMRRPDAFSSSPAPQHHTPPSPSSPPCFFLQFRITRQICWPLTAVALRAVIGERDLAAAEHDRVGDQVIPPAPPRLAVARRVLRILQRVAYVPRKVGIPMRQQDIGQGVSRNAPAQERTNTGIWAIRCQITDPHGTSCRMLAICVSKSLPAGPKFLQEWFIIRGMFTPSGRPSRSCVQPRQSGAGV
jgi:hypothetical protein